MIKFVTVIGFAIVSIGGVILSQLRRNYLTRASEKISIDTSKTIELRYASWSYIIPLLGVAFGSMFAWIAFKGASNPGQIGMSKIFSGMFFMAAIYLFYTQWKARVIIGEGKLVYVESSDRKVVFADDVSKITVNCFSFLVKSQSTGKLLKIPATFQNSELILAFLNHAAVDSGENV